jgi:hypothetical protein
MKKPILSLALLYLVALTNPTIAQESNNGQDNNNVHFNSSNLWQKINRSSLLVAQDSQWYFWVKNNSSSSIEQIFVSEDGNNWGYFELDSAITPNQKIKLIWDQSTNNEDCNQYIKAVFSDGSESTPAQFNFCEDLKTPIEFYD